MGAGDSSQRHQGAVLEQPGRHAGEGAAGALDRRLDARRSLGGRARVVDGERARGALGRGAADGVEREPTGPDRLVGEEPIDVRHRRGRTERKLHAVRDTDDDDDGVLDADDECLFTFPRDIVDYSGCSIADLCPCENQWKNHGTFVKCVAQSSKEFFSEGLITKAQRKAIVSNAAKSDCGFKD